MTANRNSKPDPELQQKWCLKRKYLFLFAGWLGINAVLFWILSPTETEIYSQHRNDELLQNFVTREIQVLRNGSDAPFKTHYQFMKPEPAVSGKKYPLVLFLHGAGVRGSDHYRHLFSLPRQMATPEWRKRFPCFLIAPQCPAGHSWSSRMDTLEEILEQAMNSLPANPKRVYLTGFSMGGFGCWELASKRPDLFAAMVPICGGGDVSTAKSLVGIPLWAVHGDADEVVSVERTRQMVEAIRQAGGSPCYTELKGVGHDSWTPIYNNPNGSIQWMFQQVKHK